MNSPYADGQDRGCASWRHFEVQALPTVEPAPLLVDEAAYEQVADGLITSGRLLDRKMIYWCARPSEHCPTLEVRIADAHPDLDTVMLYAVLLRRLATTLLAEARQGRPWPQMDSRTLEDCHRRVALDGLHARTIDPATGALVSGGRAARRTRPAQPSGSGCSWRRGTDGSVVAPLP